MKHAGLEKSQFTFVLEENKGEREREDKSFPFYYFINFDMCDFNYWMFYVIDVKN